LRHPPGSVGVLGSERIQEEKMLARALLSAFVGTAQVQLPLLGIAPPSWKWGTNEVLIDLGCTDPEM
jgi:hypothetical protein